MGEQPNQPPANTTARLLRLVHDKEQAQADARAAERAVHLAVAEASREGASIAGIAAATGIPHPSIAYWRRKGISAASD